MSSPEQGSSEAADEKDKDKDKDKDEGAEDITVDVTLDLLNPDALHMDPNIDEPVTSGGEILDDVPGTN
jgi:hypothetical protein